MAIDAAGSAYLSGMTRSSELTFPDGDGLGSLTSPANTHNGNWDAWVAKVRPDGTGLVYAGYLGGSGQDEGYGAGVDAAGAFYFTGGTQSSADFPVVVGPDRTLNGGVSDAFVAKVAPDGSHYAYVGFIGGACRSDCGPDSDELGVGLTVDAEGHAYPIGWTYGKRILPGRVRHSFCQSAPPRRRADTAMAIAPPAGSPVAHNLARR